MNDLSSILERFGVSGSKLEPLGDTQNVNSRVTTATGERFLLRQHRTVSHTVAALESELILLQYLYTHGLEGQRPVPLATGNFVLVDGSKRFSLLTWLEGEVLESLNDAQAEAVGGLMAGFHLAARDFSPPAGFERLYYDQDYFERELNVLRGIDWLHDDLPLLERAMTRAKTGFADPAGWRLIHAGLHPGNLILERFQSFGN